MSDLVTVDKLKLLKPKVSGSVGELAAVIAAASASLRSARRDLDQWIADGLVEPVLVEFVVASMVERVTTDRIKYEMISQAAFTYDTDWQSAGLYPTDDELASITPALRQGRSSKPWGAVRPEIGLAGRWRS